MTETVQKPRQLSLAELQSLIDKRPDLIKPFELAKPKLEAGTGQQDLANLIACEVGLRQEDGLYLYSWQGTNGAAYELRLPKAFDPQPIRADQPQRQTQGQASEPTTEKFEREPAAPEAAKGAAVTTGGMFAVLSRLLGDATLLMTVARTDEIEGEPTLTVTVVSEGENDLPSICLTGTAEELDLHFVKALANKAEVRARIETQIEALQAADKALEEAKKEEVAAKQKQTEAKKKSAQKKEADAEAETKAAEQKAEVQQNGTLF